MQSLSLITVTGVVTCFPHLNRRTWVKSLSSSVIPSLEEPVADDIQYFNICMRTHPRSRGLGVFTEGFKASGISICTGGMSNSTTGVSGSTTGLTCSTVFIVSWGLVISCLGLGKTCSSRHTHISGSIRNSSSFEP